MAATTLTAGAMVTHRVETFRRRDDWHGVPVTEYLAACGAEGIRSSHQSLPQARRATRPLCPECFPAGTFAGRFPAPRDITQMAVPQT